MGLLIMVGASMFIYIIQLLDNMTAVMLASQHGRCQTSSVPTSQLLLIVSDGRGMFTDGMDVVNKAVKRANEAGIFMVFVIIDNPDTTVRLGHDMTVNGAIQCVCMLCVDGQLLCLSDTQWCVMYCITGFGLHLSDILQCTNYEDYPKRNVV